MRKNVGLIIILLYVYVLLAIVVKPTPEIFLILLFVVVLLFLGVSKTKNFAASWIPFVAFFLFYEFLRGFADDYSPTIKYTLYWIYDLEKMLFNGLPTLYLQHVLKNNALVLNISLFFYSSFFYYSFVVAFILWLKDRKDFNDYAKRLIILCFMGLMVFFLIPTAPPWYVSEKTGLGIERTLYNGTIFNVFKGFSLYKYFIYGNLVAALPSLHVGWTAFTSFYLIKKYQKKFSAYISLIIPFMVGFSVVLTGEHFVLDVLAGIVLAVLAVFL